MPRRKLVERMLAEDTARIVVLAAPPGYGKTNVMMQWAARQPLPVLWLTVDHADNDPQVLVGGIAAGLGCVDDHASASLKRLLAAISDRGPVLLVLDQLEVLER